MPTKAASFNALLLAGVLAAFVQETQAWANSLPRGVATPRRQSMIVFNSNEGVESYSLKDFENHMEEGEKMAKSIAAWLDAEVSFISRHSLSKGKHNVHRL